MSSLPGVVANGMRMGRYTISPVPFDSILSISSISTSISSSSKLESLSFSPDSFFINSFNSLPVVWEIHKIGADSKRSFTFLGQLIFTRGRINKSLVYLLFLFAFNHFIIFRECFVCLFSLRQGGCEVEWREGV